MGETHRGHGLGRWLIESVVAHPDLHELRIFLLATRDAHEFYQRYGGFQELEMPEKWMIRSGEHQNTDEGAGATASYPA